MRSLPIDTTDITFVLVEVAAKLNFDTKLQDRERDTKTPAWVVRALVLGDDKPEVLEVRVYALTEPAIPAFSTIRFGGLAARQWQQGERSGMSFSATKVDIAPASTNGKPKDLAAATA